MLMMVTMVTSSPRSEHLSLFVVAVAERAAFFFLLHVAVVLFVSVERKTTTKLVDAVPVVGSSWLDFFCFLLRMTKGKRQKKIL